MMQPQRAAVRPRVISPSTGETLLLEDLVTDPATLALRRPIQIVGGPGSGKTTALSHLQAVLADWLPGHADIHPVFLDDPDSKEQIALHAQQALVVFTAAKPFPATHDWLAFRLAPWGEDDILEYLLARHRTRCGAILAGLHETDEARQLQGNPELWVLALEYLASHPTVLSPLVALRAGFLEKADSANLTKAVGRYSLGIILKLPEMAARAAHSRGAVAMGPELLRLLRHTPLQQFLAVERMAADLTEGKACSYWRHPFPRAVIHLLAEHIRNAVQAVARVKGFLTQKKRDLHPTAASICHQLDRQWLPTLLAEGTPLPCLTGAYLDHAAWPGLNLAGAQLEEADLSFANLAGVSLECAVAPRTNFHGAVLSQANLQGLAAVDACFAQADLRGAQAVSANLSQAVFQQANLDGASFQAANVQQGDFTGASLLGARFLEANLQDVTLTDTDCTDADFTRAKFDGADFRTARLDGTCWHSACLVRCNFEEVSMSGADFSKANLDDALFTASSMPAADFTAANLRNTGLAEIDWERADLRAADLRGASFHLGSSRSGLVGSPIAREGSMTGFYTDDFTEQDFKTPEEIRKANLRGADLRGANVEGVDFYLVDLREALYDEDQAVHFRACGAILQQRGQ